jgi:hypothetical protein
MRPRFKSMGRTAWSVVALSLLLSTSSRAADHRDGNTALGDATTDITDIYAFMSSDGSKVELVLDLQGANTGAVATTQFSNAALYAIHLSSGAAYNPAAPTADSDTIICKFDASATQNFQCWGPGSEYVTGATGNTSGVTSASGKMKVFAGLRDDPFHFNIRGFRATTAAVVAAAGMSPAPFTPDAAGCPVFTDPGTATTLQGVLRSNGAGGAAADDFGHNGASPPQSGVVTNGNILSIAIEIDKTLLAKNGSVVSVWASTNKAQ